MRTSICWNPFVSRNQVFVPKGAIVEVIDTPVFGSITLKYKEEEFTIANFSFNSHFEKPITTPHTLQLSDLTGFQISTVIASSTGKTGKKLLIVSEIDSQNNLISRLQVQRRTNNEQEIYIEYEGMNLYNAIKEYNKIP